MKMRSRLSLAVLAPVGLMLAAGTLGSAPALADAPKDARVSGFMPPPVQARWTRRWT
jgi:hypothetical protein